jgi:hypothetical protein
MQPNDNTTSAFITPPKPNRRRVENENNSNVEGKEKATDATGRKLDKRLECIRKVIDTQPDDSHAKIIEISLSMLVQVTKIRNKRNGVSTMETNSELFPLNIRIQPKLTFQEQFKADATTLENVGKLNDLATEFREKAKAVQVKQGKYEAKKLNDNFVKLFFDNFIDLGELFISYHKARDDIEETDGMSDQQLAVAALIACLGTISHGDDLFLRYLGETKDDVELRLRSEYFVDTTGQPVLNAATTAAITSRVVLVHYGGTYVTFGESLGQPNETPGTEGPGSDISDTRVLGTEVLETLGIGTGETPDTEVLGTPKPVTEPTTATPPTTPTTTTSPTVATITNGTKRLIVEIATRLSNLWKPMLLEIDTKNRTENKEKAGSQAIKKYLEKKKALGLAEKMQAKLEKEPPVEPDNMNAVIDSRLEIKMGHWKKQDKKEARKKYLGELKDKSLKPPPALQNEKNGEPAKKSKKRKNTPEKATTKHKKRVTFDETPLQQTKKAQNPYLKKPGTKPNNTGGRGRGRGGRGSHPGRGRGRGSGKPQRKSATSIHKKHAPH